MRLMRHARSSTARNAGTEIAIEISVNRKAPASPPGTGSRVQMAEKGLHPAGNIRAGGDRDTEFAHAAREGEDDAGESEGQCNPQPQTIKP